MPDDIMPTTQFLKITGKECQFPTHHLKIITETDSTSVSCAI